MVRILTLVILVFLSSCSALHNKNGTTKSLEMNFGSTTLEKHLLPGVIEISEEHSQLPTVKSIANTDKAELKPTMLKLINFAKKNIENKQLSKKNVFNKVALNKLNKAEKKLSAAQYQDDEMSAIYGCCCLFLLFGAIYLLFDKSNITVDFRYIGAFMAFLILTGLLIAMLAKY